MASTHKGRLAFVGLSLVLVPVLLVLVLISTPFSSSKMVGGEVGPVTCF